MNGLQDFDADELVLESVEGEPDQNMARRITLQVLYEVDSSKHAPEAVIAARLEAQQANKRVSKFVRRLVNGVLSNLGRLDTVIQQYAPEWPLDQVAIVDRNILRIAIFEFAIYGNTPVGVAIDQAVELAKLFGAEGTPRFVNGVLGTLADNTETLQQLLASVDGEPTA